MRDLDKMRKLSKLEEPSLLASNKESWLIEFIADKTNPTKKYRYRDPLIKSQLKEETYSKCAYCESKIGHNCPGDVEHKVPSSKYPEKHFEWENLTIACPECNRRKNDYFEESDDARFIDPYTDDIQELIDFAGPLLTTIAGDAYVELSIDMLELNSFEKRRELVLRRFEKCRAVNHIVNTLKRSVNREERLILRLELMRYRDASQEFSAMIDALLRKEADGLL